MRLHRFYLTEKIEEGSEIKILQTELIHQWLVVFRFHTGNQVIVFDGSGSEFLAEFVSLDKKSAVLKILESRVGVPTPTREIHLFQSLIKKDNMEWIFEKCTELGITNFHPIISERSEKKSFNIERARKIIIEASEQSGRVAIPIIHETVSLEKALENLSDEAIAFEPSGISFPRNYKLETRTCSIFIGPEGGWSEKELELFKSAGVKIYSLGSQILRAETAAVVVSALLVL